MTVEEITERKALARQNSLFQASSSPCKEFQFTQFVENGAAIEGKKPVRLSVGGKDFIALLTFQNGLLHSDSGLPAVEWKGHLEFWTKGLIQKVVDYDKNIEEVWNDGIPVKITEIER